MWLIMRSLCLPLHFVNSLMHYTCLFIDCHRGRVFFHKHVSLLETSISLFFLVRLTQLHVTRLAALQWLQHDQFLSLRAASLSICDTGIGAFPVCPSEPCTTKVVVLRSQPIPYRSTYEHTTSPSGPGLVSTFPLSSSNRTTTTPTALLVI